MSSSEEDFYDVSEDEEQEICACLLRQNCTFNREENSIKTSRHWCLNYRYKSCSNRFWGPCLENAVDHESICRICDDKNEEVKRTKSNQNKNNNNNSSTNSSSSSNVANTAPTVQMGDAEIAETAESELKLTVAYDKDITETDEAAMFIRICRESDKKTIQQQLPREFFIFICCLIGQETTTNSDKMHITDIYKTCYVAFGKYLVDGGRAFLLNTSTIIHQLTPANGWPEGVYSSLEQFMQKEYNLGAHSIPLSSSTLIRLHPSLPQSQILTFFSLFVLFQNILLYL